MFEKGRNGRLDVKGRSWDKEPAAPKGDNSGYAPCIRSGVCDVSLPPGNPQLPEPNIDTKQQLGRPYPHILGGGITCFGDMMIENAHLCVLDTTSGRYGFLMPQAFDPPPEKHARMV
ncbi:hypothetical protein Astex_2494 [Asticcacaulis excentricus CB 48]|uniref:Uncharacterized protein n=1 Tax=Asticcacaulis excentricus (strain ATCC 15261 / DSM 4724 / KCTC 12464 / NCIMB 9791 / VKM B-1370 / CB 48) TaxID=573065 RepID=E8RUU5_ASTEC|nr:hypothetical protein Astex_2494 [Asticcacaulis excentricus CB 48]